MPQLQFRECQLHRTETTDSINISMYLSTNVYLYNHLHTFNDLRKQVLKCPEILQHRKAELTTALFVSVELIIIIISTYNYY